MDLLKKRVQELPEDASECRLVATAAACALARHGFTENKEPELSTNRLAGQESKESDEGKGSSKGSSKGSRKDTVAKQFRHAEDGREISLVITQVGEQLVAQVLESALRDGGVKSGKTERDEKGEERVDEIPRKIKQCGTFSYRVDEIPRLKTLQSDQGALTFFLRSISDHMEKAIEKKDASKEGLGDRLRDGSKRPSGDGSPESGPGREPQPQPESGRAGPGPVPNGRVPWTDPFMPDPVAGGSTNPWSRPQPQSRPHPDDDPLFDPAARARPYHDPYRVYEPGMLYGPPPPHMPSVRYDPPGPFGDTPQIQPPSGPPMHPDDPRNPRNPRDPRHPPFLPPSIGEGDLYGNYPRNPFGGPGI